MPSTIAGATPQTSRGRTYGALITVAMALGTSVIIGACSADPSPLTERAVPLPTVTLTDSATPIRTGQNIAATGQPPAATAPEATNATSTVGSLVPGFPAQVIPVMPKASVTASAVTARQGTLDVSLSGRTSAPLRAVMRYYRQALTKAGFSTDPTIHPPGPKATQASLTLGRSDGSEVLIIAVLDNGTTRSFSVGGTLLDPPAAGSASAQPAAS